MDRPLISHPANPFGTDPLHLEDHLEGVANRAQTLGTGPTSEQLYTLGWLHDFAKATPQFQSYIREEYGGPEAEKQHARLGSFVTLYALGQLEADPLNRLAGTLAVARHHGTIPDGAHYAGRTLVEGSQQVAVANQIAAIDSETTSTADRIIRTATDGTCSWSEFVDQFEAGAISEALRSFSAIEEPLSGWQIHETELPERLYDRTLQYWGALTLADKSHAGGVSKGALTNYDRLSLSPLDQYIETLQGSAGTPLETQLNTLREDARQQTTRGVHAWLDDQTAPAVTTLRLPTGLGKTFTGITAALTAADRLPDTIPPRSVVYALPFTSIIEQTRAHFENDNIWGADPTGDALTVHHHLSETVTYGETAEDRDEIEFLGESWRSGVVLTTFVQLFESVVGPSTSQGTKLPALDGAIVILDEPQALPKAWWDGMPRILDILTEEYSAHVISMTATQPSLFETVETVDLLERGQQSTAGSVENDRETHTGSAYFEAAERVTYHFDDSVFSHLPDRSTAFVGHDTAADRIYSQVRANASSALAVCNTIASSRTLTNELAGMDDTTHLGSVLESVLGEHAAPATTLKRDAIAEDVLERAGLSEGAARKADNDIDIPLLTFNSRFRPFDRRVLIYMADHLATADVPFVLVATQAVEAGVDLSFQRVYRDVAPLDSIVQAAGRCNRSFEWGQRGGKVLVWTLAGTTEQTPSDPSDRPPASYIYQQEIPGHLRTIAETLAELDTDSGVTDSTVSDTAVQRYFERLAEKQVGETSIQEEIKRCRGDELTVRSLINDFETVDVVVGVSDADEAAISDVSAAFQPVATQESFEALERLSAVRVSIPVSDLESAPRIPRVDRRERDDTEGAQVFEFTDGAGLDYELAGGGLVGTDDVVAGRFTTM